MRIRRFSLWCVAFLAYGTVLSFCGPAPARADLNQGLVAHWDFDEGQGVIVHDISQHGADGYNEGGQWVAGCTGTALDLLDTDYVSVPARYDDGMSDAFSISLWVYWHGPGSGPNACYIFDSRCAGGGALRYGFYTGLDRNTHKVWIQTLCGLDSDAVSVQSNSQIPSEEWSHIAAVLDPETALLSLYVNGGLENAVPHARSYCPTYDSPAMGNNHWAPGDQRWAPLNGRLDEFRIYGRALSLDEVRELASACGSPVPVEALDWGRIKRMYR